MPIEMGLPEDYEETIITFVNTDPESYYEHIKNVPQTGFAVYYAGEWYWWSATAVEILKEYGSRFAEEKLDEAIVVTAWQPMPNPYGIKDAADRVGK